MYIVFKYALWFALKTHVMSTMRHPIEESVLIFETSYENSNYPKTVIFDAGQIKILKSGMYFVCFYHTDMQDK